MFCYMIVKLLFPSSADPFVFDVPPSPCEWFPFAGLRNVSWYAVERLIRRYFSEMGIPTFIYYYRRKRQDRATAVDGGRQGAGARAEKRSFKFCVAGESAELISGSLLILLR